jgi:hypothetical protein
MAVKCKCPECDFLFSPPKAAVARCPQCNAKVKVPVAAGRAGNDDRYNLQSEERGSGGGRQMMAVVVLIGIVLLLVAGGGLALYVMRVFQRGGPDVAQNNTTASATATNPATLPGANATTNPDGTERPVDPVVTPADPPKKDPVTTPMPKPLTEKEKKVNAAIDKGVTYLRGQLDGLVNQKRTLPEIYPQYHDGVVAIIGWTLLECGTAHDDALIKQAQAWVRAKAPMMTKTYNIATTILFLENLGDKQDLGLIQMLASRLIVGQMPYGSWTYDCPRLTDVEERNLYGYLNKIDQKVNLSAPGVKDPTGAARALPGHTQAVSVVRWLNGLKPAGMVSGDNSNTQFALLALWVAQRGGLPMRAPLALGAEYFTSVQARDGSWSYTPGGVTASNRSSMTCAGLLALAIGRGVGRKPDDRAMRLGFQYLVPVFDKSATGKSRSSGAGRVVNAEACDDLYYLWSLERVCLIYDLKKLRDTDWYEWESDVLLKSQAGDGSWQDFHAPFCDTCFALLILKRVNVVKDLKIEDRIKDEIKNVANIKEVNK